MAVRADIRPDSVILGNSPELGMINYGCVQKSLSIYTIIEITQLILITTTE